MAIATTSLSYFPFDKSAVAALTSVSRAHALALVPSGHQCFALRTSGVKRKCRFALPMSAFDPNRTFPAAVSRSRKLVKEEIDDGNLPVAGDDEIGSGVSRRRCPLLAHSGHEHVHRTCPLLTQSGHGTIVQLDLSASQRNNFRGLCNPPPEAREVRRT